MRRKTIAEVVFQCLQTPPRREAVLQLARLRSNDLARVLLHLDQTGLAIYLLHHLRQHHLFSAISPQLQMALNQRLGRNQFRAEDMFREFATVVRVFNRVGVNYAVLKGFSLVPDYSPTICVRHQTDLDLQVAPASVRAAHDALRSLGYDLESEDPGGEAKFVRELGRSLAGMADIYALQSASRIELHRYFWERRFQVELEFEHDPLARRDFKTLRNITFPVLAEEDAFIGQLLHAFRHFLKGWIRSSWLFEIASFLYARFADQVFWSRIGNCVYPEKTADACGLILLLCRQLLGTAIPEPLRKAFIAPLPRKLCVWIELFGSRWAGRDMEGSKLHLMIHEHFVPDPRSWRKQHASLLIPRRIPSVMHQSREQGETATNWRGRQARIFLQRVSFHLSRNAEYAVHNLRWRYALLG
jgi:hypothetical protein